ncbi:MAG: EF-P 5-aminopentanol modification-associated protein YfmF [Oscillospiraceae bacterium]
MDIARSEIMPGVWLSCLQTDKFKSDCISLNLLTQLDRETVSKNALIPRVLCRGTVYHPDMDAIAAACDELYGARILPSVRKLGEVLAVGFYAGFIAERFTPDGSRLLEPVAQLLGEMLLSPVTRGGLLSKDYVESEKEKLIDDIRARVNDKADYAVFRLREEMCAYEDYGCDDMGSQESAEAVGYVELTRHYRALLQTSPIEIFYCGSASPRRVEAALLDALMTLPRGEIDYDIGTDIRLNAVTAQPRVFDETMDVGQGQLALGFRLGDAMEDPDFAAIRVFNALYGGGYTSKLFLNVRERLSLCYYVYSGCDSFKGVMVVSSGIDPANVEVARGEILDQLEKVKAGDFSEEELSAARRTVASDLRSATDSAGSLESFYLSQTLKGLDYGPLELAALVEDVTAEDVIAVARGVELDSIYFLHGPDGDEEDDEDEVNEDAET